MINLKKLLFIVILFSSLFLSHLCAQSSYDWANAKNFPIYFKIPVAAVQEVNLSVTFNSAPSDFLLLNPDGTSDILKPGYAFNTLPSTSSGYYIEFTLTDAALHIYNLKIKSYTGSFTEIQTWGLGVINSSTIATVHAQVDTAATLLKNGNYWYNLTGMDFIFTIPANIGNPTDETDDVHSVNLTIQTEINTPIFTLMFPTGSGVSPQAQQWNYSAISPGVHADLGSSNGYHVDLSETSVGSGIFNLLITRRHATGLPIGTFGQMGGTDELFALRVEKPTAVTNVPADPWTSLSLSSTTLDGPDAGTDPDPILIDPVILNFQPFVAIEGPGNIPSTNPYQVTINRGFQYSSRIYDDVTAASSLTKNWYKDGSGTAFSSVEDPPATETIANYLDHFVDLKVDETVTKPDGTTFIQTSKDKLQTKTIQVETVLFPYHKGVPGSMDPPVIDGIVSPDYAISATMGPHGFPTFNNLGDRGWNEAYRNIYQNGTLPEAAFQAISNGYGDPFIYSSFEITSDPTFDQFDAILIGISADQSALTPGDDRLILIYPFPVSASGDPSLVKVWSSLYGWELSGDAHFPTNISVKVKNSGLPLSNSWNLEIKIPTSTDAAAGGADWINIPNDFLFYHNIYRVDNTVPAAKNVVEFHSPRKAPDIIGDIEAYSYNPLWWAVAKKGFSDVTTYNGIYTTYNDIKVTPVPYVPPPQTYYENATIGLPNATSPTSVKNTFEVTIHNNSYTEDASGTTYQPVSDVKVAFSVATWGIPSNRQPDEWQPAPPDSGTNPILHLTIPAKSTPGEPSRVPMDWTLTWGDSNDQPKINYYNTPPQDHQCVYVEINADSNANILTRSMYRNMEFATASELSRKAAISVRGYGNAPYGKKKQTVYLHVTKKDWRYDTSNDKKEKTRAKGSSTDSNQSEVDSYLYWEVNGYLASGNSVIIKGQKCELIDPLGSFGYVVQHDGEAMTWTDGIDGAKETAPDTYELDIAPETVAEVTTVIKPFPPLGLCASIHGGVSTPLSQFANDYGTGWNAMLDLGYKIFPHLYVMGLVGYNWFPPVSSAQSATSIVSLALNLKYFIPIQPFIEVGIGAGYDLTIQDFATVNHGYDADASIDYIINPGMVLEAGAIYHSRFNQEYWFIQSHVGIIFRF